MVVLLTYFQVNFIAKPDYNQQFVGGRIVSNTHSDYITSKQKQKKNQSESQTTTKDDEGITLLLFYQYIEPTLSESTYRLLLTHVKTITSTHSITGRIRISHEGLNCTLTATHTAILTFCRSLRDFRDGGAYYFADTEFKLTDHLPRAQRFPKLAVIPVTEIVNYGLPAVASSSGNTKAPCIAQKGGQHLEPKEYHAKVCEKDTVIIDVRNHYEAAIGKFQPPSTGATYIDPLIRKSTEFPLWLDKPSTKEMLRGKQVLMYCTGGVRCERASALLSTKMEVEADTKALGIKGVFQLQGGIDKYFREYPEGGLWKGTNFVFDRRVSQAPPAVEARLKATKDANNGKGTQGKKNKEESNANVDDSTTTIPTPIGKCEACQKPWDRYPAKCRCPTCGVPFLICRDCQKAGSNDKGRIDPSIRCDLCVHEGIRSKRQMKERESWEMAEYQRKVR